MQSDGITKKAIITIDCYHACLTHAMMSSGQEIMGFLLGDAKMPTSENEPILVYIWDVFIPPRVDKKRDRVEIEPEKQVLAATEADRLTIKDGIPTRVVGWYHSHPKITPWPSDVDYRCQQSHELMDKAFIGLIFSVFNYDPNDLKHSIQVHAFQGKMEKAKTSIEVVPTPLNYPSRALDRIVQLQEVLVQEDKQSIFLGNQTYDNPLKTMYHSAEFTKRVSRLVQGSFAPLKNLMTNELAANAAKLKAIEEEEQQLLLLLQQKQQK